MPVFNAEKGIQDWTEIPPDTVKIVLGPSPGSDEDDDAPFRLPPPPEDFAARFPQLSHLYIWGAKELSALPRLPEGLRVMDLRGCSGLKTLPDLPEGLEELDLGACSSLEELPEAPAALQRLFFNQCDALEDDELQPFLKRLRKSSAPLVEIDASGCHLTKFTNIPRGALRKLVAKDCPELKDIRAVSEFEALQHLNLSGCVEIQELPELPTRLQYLALYGAEKLSNFLGQNVGPYDRGKEGQNVLPIFQTRKKFGGELAVMPHAKLLLLGDGRVGKTTLAKRLQWEEVADQTDDHPLKPDKKQPFTHRVEYHQWKTGLVLEATAMKELQARAGQVGIQLPLDPEGRLQGALRIWDFGGQELYHHTHRIFASEGSIFLLVWRQDEPDPGPKPKDVTDEEWADWNRVRSFDYWFEYIDSLGAQKNIQLGLVCTHCPSPDAMEVEPNWRARTEHHQDREMDGFFVDALDEDCGKHRAYQRLVQWIRETCGAEALRIGILQPRFFYSVAEMVSGWTRENDAARQSGREGPRLLCTWEQWVEAIHELYERENRFGQTEELEKRDIEILTEYLHNAGHVFFIRDATTPTVLIDQEWASDLIYRLLQCGGNLRRIAKGNGGWFYGVDLENDLIWKALDDDLQRTLLLRFMRECGVITLLSSENRNRMGEDIYLASDPWLLPEYAGEVEMKADQWMRHFNEEPDIQRSHETLAFTGIRVNEFGFRALQAKLASAFGTTGLYFRGGILAIENDQAPDWGFRLRWLPDKETDGFMGTLDGVLVSRRRLHDAITQRLEDLMFAEDSPIADQRQRLHALRRERGVVDLQHAFFCGFRPEDYDVAVSSSGADQQEVAPLVAAMEAAGLKVNHYKIPECRVDEYEEVLPFMRSLGEPPCIVLVLSDAYLEDDPVQNWYCAHELADAIVRLKEGKRDKSQTIVLYKSGGSLDSKNMNERVVELMESMGEDHWRRFASMKRSVKDNFKYLEKFSDLFHAAVNDGASGEFFKARGTLGTYLKLPEDSEAPGAFDAIIEKVRAAVRTPNSQ